MEENGFYSSNNGLITSRPLLATYKSPNKNIPFEQRDSLSPLNSKRSLSSYLRSPLKSYENVQLFNASPGKGSLQQRNVIFCLS